MKYYLPTEKQQTFFNEATQHQSLRNLEKNSFSKLQLLSLRRHICIHSIQDPYQMFRIVLAAVLIKIFSQINAANMKRLARIKKVIYQSKLERLVKGKGIQKKQLFWDFAKHLMEVQVGPKASQYVLKYFNSAPFFDEIIIKAFEEYDSDLVTGSYERLKTWMKDQMDLLIIENPTIFVKQTNSELFLIKEGETFFIQSDTSFENYQVQTDESKLKDSLKKRDLVQSFSQIGCSKSPSCKEDNYRFDEKNVRPFNTKTIKKNTEKQKNGRKSRRKTEGIWNLFCCQVD